MLIYAAGVLAIIGYLGASALLAAPRPPDRPDAPVRRRLWSAVLFMALLAHSAVLAQLTFTPQGWNVSVFNAASLVAWCIALLLSLLLRRQPLASLAVVILPLAALALAVDLSVPSTYLVTETLAPGLRIHIALALIAYSLFAIAAVQAVFLAVAERQLRQHHPIMNFLPPLPTMEAVMFQLTLIAFVLLTLSLVLGALSIENIRAQHLAHKIVFSMLAWAVFATLVVGRWRYGWRGRHGVKYVCAGLVLLALAYFGTKIVLELVLHRV